MSDKPEKRDDAVKCPSCGEWDYDCICEEEDGQGVMNE